MLHQADFLREVENILSYRQDEKSLMEMSDENGCLTEEQADKLLSNHGHTFDEVLEDPYDRDFKKLQARNAEELLMWLGYKV